MAIASPRRQPAGWPIKKRTAEGSSSHGTTEKRRPMTTGAFRDCLAFITTFPSHYLPGQSRGRRLFSYPATPRKPFPFLGLRKETRPKKDRPNPAITTVAGSGVLLPPLLPPLPPLLPPLLPPVLPPLPPPTPPVLPPPVLP